MELKIVSDITSLRPLWQEAQKERAENGLFAETETLLQAYVSSENYPLFGIYKEEELIGYAVLQVQPVDLPGCRILLRELFIHSADRRQGFGSAVTQMLLDNYPGAYAVRTEQKDDSAHSFVEKQLANREVSYRVETANRADYYRFPVETE